MVFIKVYTVEWRGGEVRICRWRTAFLRTYVCIWPHAHLLMTWPTHALIEVLFLLNYVCTYGQGLLKFLLQIAKWKVPFLLEPKSKPHQPTYVHARHAFTLHIEILRNVIHHALLFASTHDPCNTPYRHTLPLAGNGISPLLTLNGHQCTLSSTLYWQLKKT